MRKQPTIKWTYPVLRSWSWELWIKLDMVCLKTTHICGILAAVSDFGWHGLDNGDRLLCGIAVLFCLRCRATSPWRALIHIGGNTKLSEQRKLSCYLSPKHYWVLMIFFAYITSFKAKNGVCKFNVLSQTCYYRTAKSSSEWSTE